MIMVKLMILIDALRSTTIFVILNLLKSTKIYNDIICIVILSNKSVI